MVRPWDKKKFGFYEFFAGGGMARIGLGSAWECLFANELCPKKAGAYKRNFPESHELLIEDVTKIKSSALPGSPDLAWASFPCQDLSQAGSGRGLNGERSGTFWAFWGLMESMNRESRPAPIIVLENVAGALTSNQGADFRAIFKALTHTGYRAGPMVINAVDFVPQSRPRLFIVAVKGAEEIDDALASSEPNPAWHTKQVMTAYSSLPKKLKKNWIWWSPNPPEPRIIELPSFIEDPPNGVKWHPEEQTEKILSMMSEVNLDKVRKAMVSKKFAVGAVYRRTRRDSDGNRVQRAEVRFDGISGCLRTPAGGSSRQILMFVNGEEVRTRLISARETARLMGLGEDYILPEKYNDAYHLTGDGLVVPVVSWLEKELLRPLAESMKMNANPRG